MLLTNGIVNEYNKKLFIIGINWYSYTNDDYWCTCSKTCLNRPLTDVYKNKKALDHLSKTLLFFIQLTNWFCSITLYLRQIELTYQSTTTHHSLVPQKLTDNHCHQSS